MAEATIMVIEVDLNCSKCYKKVKKILCKIPQIQDQVYDEKKNTVTIKVACSCNPEKIMQKIRCKGGKSIISIKIKPPDKPPKPCEQPTEVVIKLPQPLPPKILVVGCVCCRECSEGRKGGTCEHLSCGRPTCYGCYCGKPVCDSWGSGCDCGKPVCDSWDSGCDCGCKMGYYCRNRCGYYPSPCSIM